MTPTTALVAPQDAEPPFVLALDLGTSSVRAMLFDRQGRTVEGAEARQANAITVTLDGTCETNPDALLEKVWLCIDEVLARSSRLAEHVAAVCACTFVSNIMGVDAAGRAVTPLVLYADTRAAPQAKALRGLLDEDTFHQRTGTRFHTSYLPARLLWWQEQKPADFAKVKRWISIGEYMLQQIFGSGATSYSVASWTGLLNLKTLDWDEDLLQHLPAARENLPRLVDADAAWREPARRFASRWPALKKAAWFPAIGDGAAANLGSGCAAPDRVAISIGTSSAVRTVIPESGVHLPSGLWCYRVDRRRRLLGGAMIEGGSVFAWLCRLLNLTPSSSLESELARCEPAAHGLVFLPLISGERSPGWRSEARGMMDGLSIATGPIDLLRAGIEGVACRIALVYQMLRAALPAEPVITASGGAIQGSPAWQQILADALNRPVRLSRAPETSTRGAALLALEKLGLLNDLAGLPDLSEPAAEPIPANHARYQAVIARQQEIYNRLVKGQAS